MASLTGSPNGLRAMTDNQQCKTTADGFFIKHLQGQKRFAGCFSGFEATAMETFSEVEYKVSVGAHGLVLAILKTAFT